MPRCAVFESFTCVGDFLGCSCGCSVFLVRSDASYGEIVLMLFVMLLFTSFSFSLSNRVFSEGLMVSIFSQMFLNIVSFSLMS